MQLESATRRPAAALNNRILRALSAEERGEVMAQATETPLYRGQVLYRCGDAVRHFYFINRGLVSLMLDTADGRSVEVGGRGVEALTMPETLFGPERATLHSIVQVPGSAFLIERPALLALASRIVRLRELVHGYVHASIQQIAQTSACNRLHTLDQRFSRWLLVAHESACSDDAARGLHHILARPSENSGYARSRGKCVRMLPNHKESPRPAVRGQRQHVLTLCWEADRFRTAFQSLVALGDA